MSSVLPSPRAVVTSLRALSADLGARYRSLSVHQRRLLYLFVVFQTCLLALFLYIGPEAIFHWTAVLALWISAQPYGIPLILSLVTLTSFPPLFGYGTAITLCGLGWGVAAPETADHPQMNGSLLKGWAVASSGCILGASASFWTLRWAIAKHSNISFIRNTLQDPTFRAMKQAVAKKGIKMAILIRFCPFPFCYSNLFFASLNTVSFGHFIVATALITPKLLMHVFLGTRMFRLMDRDERAKSTGWEKALNVVYIVLGALVGMLTSWIVWRETQRILDQMPASQLNTSGHDHHRHHRPREFVLEFDANQDEGRAGDASQESRDTEDPEVALLPRSKRGRDIEPFVIDEEDDEDEESYAHKAAAGGRKPFR
ncbi:Tlg2-vesicle protein [Thecaphora frezii]